MTSVEVQRAAAVKVTSPMTSSYPRPPPVELVLPLPVFLDCFPVPHVGRIVSGLDVLTRPECGVPPDAVFRFRRCWVGGGGARRLTWRPETGDEVIVDVADDVDLRFRVLSAGDGRHASVSELAAAFPLCPVRVESIAPMPGVTLQAGDRVKVVRLVWKDGEKCVQCRRAVDRRLVDVPFTCAAQFVDEPDHVARSFDDLTRLQGFALRQRPVQLCTDDKQVNRVSFTDLTRMTLTSGGARALTPGAKLRGAAPTTGNAHPTCTE